jgi:tetratricopeptide (TPR) repeat protein
MLLLWTASAWGQDAPAGAASVGQEATPAAFAFPQGEEAGLDRGAPFEMLGAPGPAADLSLDPITRAWFSASGSLPDRVERTLKAAVEAGSPNLEGPARALLLDESLGGPLERAEAAVVLAPDLPAARIALAAALWREERAPLAALEQAWQGVLAVDRHLEASLWLRATRPAALAIALVIGALFFLLVAGAKVVPATAHLLDDLPGGMPLVSRAALVVGVLLVPAVLGEGIFGVALAFATVAFLLGGSWSRIAVCVALLVVFTGLYPLAERAGRGLVALDSDPVTEAVFSVEHRQPSRMEVVRLRRAATGDPLVARALALHAKRSGDLQGADQRFSALIDENASASLLNNAANVRLALGRTDEAIALYEAAAKNQAIVALFFNLSQAYGRAIRLEDQELALTQAQRIDPEGVATLTDLEAGSSSRVAVDVPVEISLLRERLGDPVAARRAASMLRLRFAPGWLGQGPVQGAIGLALVVVLGAGIATVLEKMGKGGLHDEHYNGIAQLLKGKEASDPFLRMVRLTELRVRQARIAKIKLAVSLVVPGTAGVLFRRPLLGLMASLLFALALASWWARDGVVTDPLALGACASLIFGTAAFAFAASYLAVLAVTIAFGERS